MNPFSSRRALVLGLTLTFALSACASGSSSTGARRSSANRISQDELQSMLQLDAYQAIQRLRPTWMRSRAGSQPQVVVDGNRQSGGLEALRAFRVAEIQEMRYLSARDATTRFGTGYDGGAILITTKR
ncbi:MAG: hypothetical protein ACE5GJ_12805 [Gemmatimonadota bacterium]